MRLCDATASWFGDALGVGPVALRPRDLTCLANGRVPYEARVTRSCIHKRVRICRCGVRDLLLPLEQVAPAAGGQGPQVGPDSPPLTLHCLSVSHPEGL